MGKVPSLTLRVKADRILLSIDHILDAIASTDSSDSVGSGSPTTIWSMPNMLILIKQTNPLNSPEISLGWRQCNSHWEGEVCTSRRLRSLSLGFRLTDSRVLDVIKKRGNIKWSFYDIYVCGAQWWSFLQARPSSYSSEPGLILSLLWPLNVEPRRLPLSGRNTALSSPAALTPSPHLPPDL